MEKIPFLIVTIHLRCIRIWYISWVGLEAHMFITFLHIHVDYMQY